jgi:hypothetical protein
VVRRQEGPPQGFSQGLGTPQGEGPQDTQAEAQGSRQGQERETQEGFDPQAPQGHKGFAEQSAGKTQAEAEEHLGQQR